MENIAWTVGAWACFIMAVVNIGRTTYENAVKKLDRSAWGWIRDVYALACLSAWWLLLPR
jgi:hypothetical protein